MAIFQRGDFVNIFRKVPQAWKGARRQINVDFFIKLFTFSPHWLGFTVLEAETLILTRRIFYKNSILQRKIRFTYNGFRLQGFINCTEKVFFVTFSFMARKWVFNCLLHTEKQEEKYLFKYHQNWKANNHFGLLDDFSALG